MHYALTQQNIQHKKKQNKNAPLKKIVPNYISCDCALIYLSEAFKFLFLSSCE